MPMYYDMTGCRRKRRLDPAHHELACTFVSELKAGNYFDRPAAPLTDIWTDGDITRDAVACWLYIRRWLAEHTPHMLFAHRKELADHGDGRGQHGHMSPPLIVIVRDIPETFQTTEREWARAERDLRGLVGMRVASSRAKLNAEEVFA